MILEIKKVTKYFIQNGIKLEVHKDISFGVNEGEFLCVLGPSGCGKSTMLNLIGCMDAPTTGEVFIDGRPISKLNDKQLTSLRLEKLGFIFQSFNLIPVLTVFQNIELPA